MARPESTDSKYLDIQKHLLKYKFISSLLAFENYAVTRLSAIIYRLRYDKQWTIDSTKAQYIDKKGNTAYYSRYTLKSTTPPSRRNTPKKVTKK